MADAAVELARDLARLRLTTAAAVEARVVAGEAEAVGVLHQLADLGRAQQRLGRDAAPVQADAAQMLALDQRRLHAELGRADRRDIAAGAAADHDEVEVLRHVHPPLPSPASHPPAAGCRIAARLSTPTRRQRLPGVRRWW